ncbi:unnamed protein product [Somion occarium]|uniref:Uncharacterized protein n=1 Tax=Somion occarium TaxID=3059160 RepID=A0ABP1DHQ4_9APHY
MHPCLTFRVGLYHGLVNNYVSLSDPCMGDVGLVDNYFMLGHYSTHLLQPASLYQPPVQSQSALGLSSRIGFYMGSTSHSNLRVHWSNQCLFEFRPIAMRGPSSDGHFRNLPLCTIDYSGNCYLRPWQENGH